MFILPRTLLATNSLITGEVRTYQAGKTEVQAGIGAGAWLGNIQGS